MPYMTKETKTKIFKEYGGSEENTGSIEGQVALLTLSIKEISDHLKTHKKDHSTRRALLKMVGQRKRLLKYLAKRDINGYRELIKKLGIRK